MFYKSNKNQLFMDIAIPSIFFDIYIPIATGDQLKVYLLGYKSAQLYNGVNDENTNNRIIANMVGISEQEVKECWKFWEEMGAIKIYADIDSDDLSIEFLDIKSEFINKNSNISNSTEDEISDDPDFLNQLNTTKSETFVVMYDKIESISGRILTPNEKISILNTIEEYSLPTELVVEAFNRAKNDTGKIKSINYVIGILKSWFDNSIKTLEDLEFYNSSRSDLISKYSKIFKSLGFFRNPSSAEEKIMNKWISEYNMSMDIILKACSKSASISNPNLKYFDSIITDWYEKGLKTIEEIDADEKNFEENKKNKKKEIKSKQTTSKAKKIQKNKFHNYDQGISDKYTDDELNALIKKLNKQ